MSENNGATGACAPIYRAIYQLFSDETGASAAGAIDNINDLKSSLQTLFGSGPTREPSFSKPLDYPRSEIDTVVPEDVLTKLLARTEKTFVALADTEPHWAVITNEMFRADRIEDSKERFYDTGLDNLHQLEAFLERHAIDPARIETCFELGAGVGRVTFWLARKFQRVIATDISSRMLELADEYLCAHGIHNVSYTPLVDFGFFDALEPFDMFYSSIVLQHNTPPVQRYMLSKILSKLRPGGVALFQMIGAIRHCRFNAEEYLAEQVDGPRIEMHPLQHKELFAIANEQHCRLLEIREEGSCGPTPDMVSNIVLLQKSA